MSIRHLGRAAALVAACLATAACEPADDTGNPDFERSIQDLEAQNEEAAMRGLGFDRGEGDAGEAAEGEGAERPAAPAICEELGAETRRECAQAIRDQLRGCIADCRGEGRAAFEACADEGGEAEDCFDAGLEAAHACHQGCVESVRPERPARPEGEEGERPERPARPEGDGAERPARERPAPPADGEGDAEGDDGGEG
ncbi:MAG: hypothetical protein H6701_04540 [Myxococcales bacterium]|nr:hypothetical protein [Myxococcales bacterium]